MVETEKKAELEKEFKQLQKNVEAENYSHRFQNAVKSLRVVNFLKTKTEDDFHPDFVAKWIRRAREARIECVLDLTESSSHDMLVGEYNSKLKDMIKTQIQKRAD